MTHVYAVEAAILQHLNEQDSATMEELFRSLSRFTINQLFFAVDRLSRDGKIRLRQPARFTYLLSTAVSSTRTEVGPSADR